MNISVIGGDKRTQYLIELFEGEGYNILNNSVGLNKENTIEECINKSNIIVLPIPISFDAVNLNTSLSKNQISLETLCSIIHNKIIFGGKFSNELASILTENNNRVIDLLKDEQLILMNTIPTAEGVIDLIINKTDITICDSNIAVIGFGRVGKRIASTLKLLDAVVYCKDMIKEEVANIRMCGYNIFENFSKDNGFDVIINTAPSLVLDKEQLLQVSKKTLIIDVSSKPGGVDFEYALNNGYNVIHELGIPGKVAPRTSAKYIKQAIINYLK